MASAVEGSEVRQGYSSIRRWKKSSRREGSVRNHECERLWVLLPRPWLEMKGQKSSENGWWAVEQLVRMSRLKRGGRWRMWIQRLVQSESRSDCCWRVAEGKMVRKSRKMTTVVVVAANGGDVGGAMER